MPLSTIDDGHLNRFIGDTRAKTKPPKKIKLRKRAKQIQPAPSVPPAPISARRVNMVIARLRSIFATAYRRKLIATDPMRHVANLREPRREADPFDLEETRLIIEAAEGWERSFVTVLLYTGLRPGEAIALHWDAIDWKLGLILVRATQSRRYGGAACPKRAGFGARGRDDRVCPASVRSNARARKMKGDLVFPSLAGKAIDPANFRARNWVF